MPVVFRQVPGSFGCSLSVSVMLRWDQLYIYILMPILNGLNPEVSNQADSSILHGFASFENG
jgi:hypothetical protein